MGVIYQIRSIVNNKVYIGSATVFQRRKNAHVLHLKKGKHHSVLLQRHADKYGLHDLVFEILETVPDDLLIEREQYYIDNTDSEFNVCKIAGSCLGKRHSEDVKVKMSESRKGKPAHNKGKPHSAEHREKIRIAGLKRKDTDETKARKSEAQRNRIPPRGYKRKPFTEEHRKKLGDAFRGRPAWNKGVPMNEEYRKNYLAAMENVVVVPWNKGKKMPPEIVAKNVGKKRSEESRERMRQSRLNYLKKQKENGAAV